MAAPLLHDRRVLLHVHGNSGKTLGILFHDPGEAGNVRGMLLDASPPLLHARRMLLHDLGEALQGLGKLL
jgi:hypothetical protein